MNLPYNKLLKHLGLSLVFNTLIALAITAFGHQPFAINLLYSQLIGLLIWALIDIGRFYWHPNGWPSTPAMVALVAVSTVVGYFGGSAVGNVIQGFSALHGWSEFPKMMVGFLLMSLVAGTVITYYFVSREKLHRVNLERQEALRHASQAQLALLQSQLEPHMLFNTLANLRALITTDPQRATHMLDRLNDYLRSTLSASRVLERGQDHCLAAEFDRLRDYLELMAVRMGPRLQYHLNLPPNLADTPVPPLVLQSLVENAIVHGLEPQVAGGSVHVSAQLDGGMLILQVADTGVGNPHELSNEGFGITQVRERIATRYGTLATINFIATQAMNTWTTGLFEPQNATLGASSAPSASSHGITVQLRVPFNLAKA
jgi:signal transduction histidine kinase